MPKIIKGEVQRRLQGIFTSLRYNESYNEQSRTRTILATIVLKKEGVA